MTPKHPVQSLDTARKRIGWLYRQYVSWRAVSREIGVSPGTLIRIASGYEPKTPHIRRALGLPPLVTVAACATCGEAHVLLRCPKRRRYRDLWEMPTAELARRLRERTDAE